MTANTEKGLTKITVKLYAPMYADFDRQLATALLRRDAFLDRMIALEVPNLRHDLAGKRLSQEANRYISGCLKRLGGRNTPKLRTVSIAIRHETAEALRLVVNDHNLVRDAFLNRLIALLRASDKLLKALDLPIRVTWGRNDGTDDMPTGPLKAIEETLWDPFYYLRAACQKRHGCGLHMLEFPVDFMGFHCHLEDEHVPGTSAFEEREEENRMLDEALEFLESNLTPAKR